MARVASARRYAQAVFELARDRDELDRWRDDLATMAEVGKDPELGVILQNPRVHFQQKKGLLSQILDGVNPLAMNLAYLLAARNRWGIMEHIATEYNLLVDAYQGIEHAEVTTAVPIDEEDERHLEKRLEEIIGKKTVVSTRVNPAIMGGLVTKVGDRLLDGSTRTKLLALKRSMIEGTR